MPDATSDRPPEASAGATSDRPPEASTGASSDAAPEISNALDEMTAELIGAAAELLEAGQNLGIMLACDAADEVLSFEGDMPDGCYRAACDHIASLGAHASRYALLYEGAVASDVGDQACPALLFEFGERGMNNAWSGYVFYRINADGLVEISDPLPAGAEELLLA